MSVGKYAFEKSKIIQGDCLEKMKLIPDNSVDLIICDAPYGKLINEKWDSKNGLNNDILNEYWRILKDTGSIYIFCGIGEKSNSLYENLTMIYNTKFTFKDLITWKKQKGYGAKKGWLYVREEMIWIAKNKPFWNEENQYNENEKRNYKRKIGKSWFKRLTNVWDDINENLFEKINKDRIDGQWHNNLNKNYPTLHKTIKPVKLIERIIKAHTTKGMIVLDNFSGSGTTGEACINLNRDFILIEKEPNYYEVIKERVGKIFKNYGLDLQPLLDERM